MFGGVKAGSTEVASGCMDFARNCTPFHALFRVQVPI
jgi:hypothetical protein